MSTIKDTPAYWKYFLLEVLAMVKQLGLPTLFMTLSCTDLHLNELISIIGKLNGKNLLGEDINNLDFLPALQLCQDESRFTCTSFPAQG